MLPFQRHKVSPTLSSEQCLFHGSDACGVATAAFVLSAYATFGPCTACTKRAAAPAACAPAARDLGGLFADARLCQARMGW